MSTLTSGDLSEYSNMVFPNFTPLTDEQIQSINAVKKKENEQYHGTEDGTSNHKTNVFYHPDMAKHYTGINHPERSDRVYAAINGLIDGNVNQIVNMVEIEKRNDTTDQIKLCHDEEYIWLVEEEINNIPMVYSKKRERFLSLSGDQDIIDQDVLSNINIPESIDEFCTSLSTGDVMISKDSLHSALLSVDCALHAIDSVFQKKCKNAFAITRPPGHHASMQTGQGFCIFNNVAIAAAYAQKQYKAERVLIIDWDVHHGNGTQEIFHSDPSVLLFQTQEENIYPGTAKEEDIGEGGAEGTQINRLYPKWTGIEKFGPLFMNELQEFLTKHHHAGSNIDLVLVSCGFDSHVDDYLGDLGLKSEDFGVLTQIVCHHAETILGHDRVVVLMEGGYNLQAIGEGTAYVCKSLAEYSHGHGAIPKGFQGEEEKYAEDHVSTA